MFAILFFLVGGVISAAFFLYKAFNTAVSLFAIFAVTIAVSIVPDAIGGSFLKYILGPNTAVLWLGWLFFLALSVVWLEEIGLYISLALACVLFLLWLGYDFDVALTVLGFSIYVPAIGAIKKTVVALVIPINDSVWGCILYGFVFFAMLAPLVSFCVSGFDSDKKMDFYSLIISFPLFVGYLALSMRRNKFI